MVTESIFKGQQGIVRQASAGRCLADYTVRAITGCQSASQGNLHHTSSRRGPLNAEALLRRWHAEGRLTALLEVVDDVLGSDLVGQVA